MGWEVKIDMNGQTKDCLWVCNVKMKKFLPGRKWGTFLWIFGFRGRSVKRFENFFMGFGVPMSLSVADIFGLILHGAFQTKFLGILHHKLSTFMLIRRGDGCLKCDFRIFGILGNYFIMVGHHVMVLL